jgi:RNA polymerase sigma factor (sigma-70 family)
MSGEPTAREMLRRLRRVAARLVGTRDEADDLVQEALLAALEQDRDLDEARFLAWATGVIRRSVMFRARTAGRRRRREATYAAETSAPPLPFARLPRAFIDSLPRSLQTVALLANAGVGRTEVAHVLGLSEAAVRKRISDLRRAWRKSGAGPDLALRSPQHRPPCGNLRRSLRSTLRKLPDARFAVADPDGHEIFLASAHKTATRGN